MAAYLVGGVHVHDSETYEKYLINGAPSFAGFDVEVVALCDNPNNLEGTNAPSRYVILKFPDKATAEAWYHSDAYSGAKHFRHESAETLFLAVVEHDAPLPSA